MVDEQEIVRVARAKAEELESTAAAKSSALRTAAMEFIDDALPPRGGVREHRPRGDSLFQSALPRYRRSQRALHSARQEPAGDGAKE